MCVHTQSADSKLGKKRNGLHGYHGTKNRIKDPFFLGFVLINVGKHAGTESLIEMHFKRKHFSEICIEEILSRVKIYLHQTGNGVGAGNRNYFHQADNIWLFVFTHMRYNYTTKQNQNMFFQILPLMCSLQRNYDVIRN